MTASCHVDRVLSVPVRTLINKQVLSCSLMSVNLLFGKKTVTESSNVCEFIFFSKSNYSMVVCFFEELYFQR